MTPSPTDKGCCEKCIAPEVEVGAPIWFNCKYHGDCPCHSPSANETGKECLCKSNGDPVLEPAEHSLDHCRSLGAPNLKAEVERHLATPDPKELSWAVVEARLEALHPENFVSGVWKMDDDAEKTWKHDVKGTLDTIKDFIRQKKAVWQQEAVEEYKRQHES